MISSAGKAAISSALAPHCPLGPIALAACLQVGFATPNYLIQEQSIGIHYNQGADVLDYLLDSEPFAFVDGHIERFDAHRRFGLARHVRQLAAIMADVGDLVGDDQMMPGVDGRLDVVADHAAAPAAGGHRSGVGITQ